MTSKKVALVDICRALTSREFVFYFQPIISLKTGRISSSEALLRWKTQDGGILLPSAFLPIAVTAGFMPEITREIFPILVDNLSVLQEEGILLPVTFNLCVEDLCSPDIVPWMLHILNKNGVKPQSLQVEIPESTFFPMDSRIHETINNFAIADITTLLDDFSAGYTTANQLSELSIKYLKISQSVIQQAPFSKKAFRVLRHLISMGHQIELEIIGEGVETKEQYNLALSTGCSAAQGFFLGKPLPFTNFVSFVRKQPAWLNYPFGLEYLVQIDLIDFRRDVIREAFQIQATKDENLRKRSLSRLPNLHYEECLFGKWLTTMGSYWPKTAEYDELITLHQKFHQTAIEIIHTAENGSTKNSLLKLIDSFSTQSIDILAIMNTRSLKSLQNHYNKPISYNRVGDTK
ncbi:MAG: EAL domain-containing protein [Smithella sp.]